MAVAYRASSYAEVYLSFVTSGTITNTGNIQNGDFILMLSSMTSAVNWTMPTGFVPLAQFTNGAGYTIWAWGKWALNEPSTYTCNAGTGGAAGGVAVASYSGVSSVSPVSVLIEQDNDVAAEVDFPSLNAPTANGMLVCSSSYATGQTMGTVPAGFTALRTSGRHTWIQKTVAGTGATGTVAWPTTGSGVTVAFSLHLSSGDVAPFNVDAPAITGNNWNGQSLTASPTTWLNPDYYVYTWKRDGVAV